MDGVRPMDATFCKVESKRSRASAMMALVLAASSVVCVLSITVAVFCVYSLTEIQAQWREQMDQMQVRMTEVESRCKQIESGFPDFAADLGEADDAMKAGEIPGVSHSSVMVKGDPGDMAVTDPETTGEHNAEEDGNRILDIRKRQAGGQGRRGKRGHKGDPGERGPKGDQGERGVPGSCNCTHHHGHHHAAATPAPDAVSEPTPATPPMGVLQGQQSALVAHFEGSREATIDTGPSGWVPHWRMADWMRDREDLSSKFRLHHTGNVTVFDGGVYYVYSQMVYNGYPESTETPHAMGHSVYLNNTAKLTCKESTSVNQFTCRNQINSRDGNALTCTSNAQHFNRRTCNIAGVVHIPAGYHLGIKITYDNTIISFNHAKTFWGFFKLHD